MVNGTTSSILGSYTSCKCYLLTRSYYGNGIDLLKVIGFDGNTVKAGYNIDTNVHQLLAFSNALQEVTTYQYDSATRQLTNRVLPTGLNTAFQYYRGSGTNLHNLNFLKEVVDVGFRANSFGYTNGLVAIHTNELGLVVTNIWDNLQRLTGQLDDRGSISYTYDKLDLVRIIDRLSQSNSFGYNAARQRVAATNALGTITRFEYGSCGCGVLDSITGVPFATLCDAGGQHAVALAA